MSTSDPGTRVTFAPDHSQQWVTEEPPGTVAVPTDEEIDYAREHYDDRGVDHGSILVEWDDGGRAWHALEDLIEL